MRKTIVIAGPGGSGKDYLKKKFVEKGYVPSVSYTTRPPREGEVNGKDYYFVSKFEFEEMKELGMFLETDSFNGWQYGTPISAFSTADVMIMTPRGVAQIPAKYRESCMVIFLDVSQLTRQVRLRERADADNSARRIYADEIDFKDFTDFDIKITNPDF